jgi:hypothetical protein
MTLDQIVVQLDDVDRLESEAAAARRAPAAAEDLLEAAKLHLARSEALFRASPLHLPPTGGPQAAGMWLLGFGMTLAPAVLLPVVTANIKDRLAGLEDSALTAAQRRDRIAGAEQRIGTIISEFTASDLRAVRNRASSLHAAYRGLSGRRDELQALIAAKDRELQRAAEDRASGFGEQLPPDRREWMPPSSPEDPFPGAAPERTSRVAPTRSDREAAALAADRQRVEAEQELAADRADLEEIERQTEAAAVLWREWAARTKRLEQLMLRDAA